MDTNKRPDGMTDAHLLYLDQLQESGVVNMFGAAPYLQSAFLITIEQAREYLFYWMSTFGNEDR